MLTLIVQYSFLHRPSPVYMVYTARKEMLTILLHSIRVSRSNTAHLSEVISKNDASYNENNRASSPVIPSWLSQHSPAIKYLKHGTRSDDSKSRLNARATRNATRPDVPHPLNTTTPWGRTIPRLDFLRVTLRWSLYGRGNLLQTYLGKLIFRVLCVLLVKGSSHTIVVLCVTCALVQQCGGLKQCEKIQCTRGINTDMLL